MSGITKKYFEKMRRFRLNLRLVLWLIFGLLVLFVFVIPFLSFDLGETSVWFNQHYITILQRSYGSLSFVDSIRSSFSLYTQMFYYTYFDLPVQPVNFKDTDSFLEYVFGHIPPYALVQPTELYYYFKFNLEEQHISGNIRLVGLQEGFLSIGYFDAEDNSQALSKYYDSSNGLDIKQINPSLYRVKYNGHTVYFMYPAILDDELVSESASVDEIFISKVRDESGVVFNLYFNDFTRTFYYSLDYERNPTDTLIRVENYPLFIGERTNFAYYYDEFSDRTFLIGVSLASIYNNDYFDGPFDQVPPYLSLKEMIVKAYPYTQIRPVDEHGNFVDTEGMRMAISSYIDYSSINDLVNLYLYCNDLADNSEKITCLTDDEKRHFHEASPAFNKDGTLKKGFGNYSFS